MIHKIGVPITIVNSIIAATSPLFNLSLETGGNMIMVIQLSWLETTAKPAMVTDAF